MSEKRRIKRRHLIYYLKVMENDSERLVGFLVDITTKGIMIMSESPVEVDKIFRLKIRLQTDLSTQENLYFDARSKWCKKSVNTDLYDAGFELIDMTAEDFKGIESIIEELGFND